MSRVLINGQDVNYTSDFPQMVYDTWKEIPEDLRPNYTVITDRDYTGEPLDISVSVTADGVKTFGELLNDLYALVDKSKITRNTKIVRGYNGIEFIYSINRIQSNNYNFTTLRNTDVDCTTATLWFNATNSAAIEAIMTASGTTLNPQTSSVLTEGTTITLYYNIVSSGGVIDIAADDVSYGSGTVKDALDDLSDDLAQLTIKTETQSVTSNAVGTFTITKPTGAKAYWVVETDKYASSYFVRYREHVYGIFGYAAPHEPYQGALTVTVQYI